MPIPASPVVSAFPTSHAAADNNYATVTTTVFTNAAATPIHNFLLTPPRVPSSPSLNPVSPALFFDNVANNNKSNQNHHRQKQQNHQCNMISDCNPGNNDNNANSNRSTVDEEEAKKEEAKTDGTFVNIPPGFGCNNNNELNVNDQQHCPSETAAEQQKFDCGIEEAPMEEEQQQKLLPMEFELEWVHNNNNDDEDDKQQQQCNQRRRRRKMWQQRFDEEPEEREDEQQQQRMVEMLQDDEKAAAAHCSPRAFASIPSDVSLQQQLHQCSACHQLIMDTHMAKIFPLCRFLHERCARCSVCDCALLLDNEEFEQQQQAEEVEEQQQQVQQAKQPQQTKCFERDGRLFCTMHYLQYFCPSICAGCNRPIEASDFVYKLKAGIVYHLECHRCVQCGCRLPEGEQIMVDEQSKTVACARHFLGTDANNSLTNLLIGQQLLLREEQAEKTTMRNNNSDGGIQVGNDGCGIAASAMNNCGDIDYAAQSVSQAMGGIVSVAGGEVAFQPNCSILTNESQCGQDIGSGIIGQQQFSQIEMAQLQLQFGIGNCENPEQMLVDDSTFGNNGTSALTASSIVIEEQQKQLMHAEAQIQQELAIGCRLSQMMQVTTTATSNAFDGFIQADGRDGAGGPIAAAKTNCATTATDSEAMRTITNSGIGTMAAASFIATTTGTAMPQMHSLPKASNTSSQQTTSALAARNAPLLQFERKQRQRQKAEQEERFEEFIQQLQSSDRKQRRRQKEEKEERFEQFIQQLTGGGGSNDNSAVHSPLQQQAAANAAVVNAPVIGSPPICYNVQQQQMNSPKQSPPIVAAVAPINVQSLPQSQQQEEPAPVEGVVRYTLDGIKAAWFERRQQQNSARQQQKLNVRKKKEKQKKPLKSSSKLMMAQQKASAAAAIAGHMKDSCGGTIAPMPLLVPQYPFEMYAAGEQFSRQEEESQQQVQGNKRRGPRTAISQHQLDILNAMFASTPKPSKHARAKLAIDAGLSMRVIQVWFQNRRSKERRLKHLCNFLRHYEGQQQCKEGFGDDEQENDGGEKLMMMRQMEQGNKKNDDNYDVDAMLDEDDDGIEVMEMNSGDEEEKQQQLLSI